MAEAANKREQLKEKIGQAAMQCFARYGLEKTTLDDIARAVHLNKASLYYYYKNKEAIFLDVALREGQHYLYTLQQKTANKKGVKKQVLFYLQERIYYYKQVLNLNKVGLEARNRMLPRFFELYDEVLKEETVFLARLLKDGMKRGELKNTNAEKLAAALINMSDAVKHHEERRAALKAVSDVDYSEAVQHLKLLVQATFTGLKN